MIRTLTLNPAVDKSVTIDHFVVGRVNRIQTLRMDAGGKGLNVARVIHRLGGEALAVAPAGGSTGRFLAERLVEEGIPHELLSIPGETRTNLKVVDPILGSHTDINEPGPSLDAFSVERLIRLLLEGLGPRDWIVLSGSAPKGTVPSVYADIAQKARTSGVKVVLDADGELLDQGLSGRPDVVKPNLDELAAWYGKALSTQNDLFLAVKAIQRAGAGLVIVSMGSDGAWVFSQTEAWSVPGLKVEAKSTVGAGDAMVGALTLALAQGKAPPEALIMAAATATASVVRPGTGFGRPEDITSFASMLTVQHHPF